jgi:hypothetical protein
LAAAPVAVSNRTSELVFQSKYSGPARILP